jgi:DNA-binding LytR/AlgR family response regulator
MIKAIIVDDEKMSRQTLRKVAGAILPGSGGNCRM